MTRPVIYKGVVYKSVSELCRAYDIPVHRYHYVEVRYKLYNVDDIVAFCLGYDFSIKGYIKGSKKGHKQSLWNKSTTLEQVRNLITKGTKNG